MAMQQAHSVEDMVETLGELAEDYADKAEVYNKIERKWRSVMFKIAVIMGVLPIISGSATMLPEKIGPWFALGISLINVTIVIVNTKMDLGERVADAAMAGQGYMKLATTLGFMLTEVRMGKNVEITEKLTECKAITDNIGANITYPEIPGGGIIGMIMGMLSGICPCFKQAAQAKATLSAVKPDAVTSMAAGATS